MATAQRHRDIGAEFMEHADDLLRQGDLLQASEKAWGAVCHHIGAIARDKGWRSDRHQHLKDAVRRLIALDPPNTDNLRLKWISAEALHVNFYQELDTEDDVRRQIGDAKDLIAALEALALRE